MTDKEGWVMLHRQLLDKPIWKLSTPEQKTILIAILLMVWHRGNEWEWEGQRFKTEPGQVVTSLDTIVNACGKGISIQNVRTALTRFEKLGFLTNQSTKTGRLITIVNWGNYQSQENETNKEINNAITNNSQSPNKALTPNNNVKNTNNVKKKDNVHSDEQNALFERVWKLYPSKKGKAYVTAKAKKRLLELGEEQVIRAINRYKQGLQKDTWRNPQNGSTFFNSGINDYLDKNYQQIESEVQKGMEWYGENNSVQSWDE